MKLFAQHQHTTHAEHVQLDGQLQGFVEANGGRRMKHDVHLAFQDLSMFLADAEAFVQDVSGDKVNLVGERGLLAAKAVVQLRGGWFEEVGMGV